MNPDCRLQLEPHNRGEIYCSGEIPLEKVNPGFRDMGAVLYAAVAYHNAILERYCFGVVLFDDFAYPLIFLRHHNEGFRLDLLVGLVVRAVHSNE
jgi:hypothetical protein